MGSILQRTFRAEKGYIYFDWWNSDQSGRERRIERTIKARIEEPRAAS